MIKSIEIKNFKSIKDSKIDLKENLSAIYGPNGTGKTAIIEVLNIAREYFLGSLKKENREKLEKEILKSISINEKSTYIGIIFSIDNYDYKISIEFIKDNQKKIHISKEEILYREIKPRRTFRKLARLKNSLIPEIYFNSSKENAFESVIRKYILKDDDLGRNFLTEFNNLSSYFSLILKYYNELKEEEQKSIPEILSNFIIHFKKIFKVFLQMVIITLQEQALYNLNLLIPFNFHTENFHGTLTVNHNNKSGNIYSEKEAEILEDSIKDINSIFSIIIPNSKLSTERKIEAIENEEVRIGISVYVEKDNKKIPLDQESTGIIKIVSLLSIILYYVKDKNAIVAIDEFDIHIFEYLLAIFLEKVSYYAKGQFIFTAHNLLPMEKLNRNSIIISTKDENQNIKYVYLNGASATTNLRQKYLKSQRIWSEDNIEPLLLNIPALEMYIKDLVK